MHFSKSLAYNHIQWTMQGIDNLEMPTHAWMRVLVSQMSKTLASDDIQYELRELLGITGWQKNYKIVYMTYTPCSIGDRSKVTPRV